MAVCRVVSFIKKEKLMNDFILVLGSQVLLLDFIKLQLCQTEGRVRVIFLKGEGCSRVD